MKKLLIFLLLICVTKVFAYNFPIENDLILLGINGAYSIEKHSNQVTFIRTDGPEYYSKTYKGYYNETVYDSINLDSIELKDNGWFESFLFGSNQLIIFGGDYFLFHDINQSLYSCFVNSSLFSDNKEQQKNGKIYFCGERVKEISSIIVPDKLQETIKGKTVDYNTYDMEHYFYRIPDEVLFFNRNANPWATAKEPKGMIIEMSFYNPRNVITILNGFVNPDKPHLYKYNRRLKTIKIFTDEFQKIVNFEDCVHFEEILLPVEVTSVKIEILDYYEGERYKDLCVQMFGVPMSQNWYNYRKKHAEAYKKNYIPFSDLDNYSKYTTQLFSPEDKIFIKK